MTIKSRGKRRKHYRPKNFDRIDRGKKDKLSTEGRRIESRYVPSKRKVSKSAPIKSKRRRTSSRSSGYPPTHALLQPGARPLKTSFREEEDAYPNVVAVLNPKTRVITCNEGIQWVLQFQRGQRHGLPIWRGRSFCVYRDPLLQCVWELCVRALCPQIVCVPRRCIQDRCVWELCGPVDKDALEVLRSLPERIRRPTNIIKETETASDGLDDLEH